MDHSFERVAVKQNPGICGRNIGYFVISILILLHSVAQIIIAVKNQQTIDCPIQPNLAHSALLAGVAQLGLALMAGWFAIIKSCCEPLNPTSRFILWIIIIIIAFISCYILYQLSYVSYYVAMNVLDVQYTEPLSSKYCSIVLFRFTLFSVIYIAIGILLVVCDVLPAALYRWWRKASGHS